MSYSRWSTSVWYTFWTWSGSDEFTFPTQSRKNKQTFEICDLMSYYVNYGELDDIGVDNAIKEIKSFYSKSYDLTLMGDKVPFKKDVNEEEFEELKGYLLAFIDDVDDHFKWKNFFKYEWYYPFRNKIIFWYRDKFKK